MQWRLSAESVAARSSSIGKISGPRLPSGRSHAPAEVFAGGLAQAGIRSGHSDRTDIPGDAGRCVSFLKKSGCGLRPRTATEQEELETVGYISREGDILICRRCWCKEHSTFYDRLGRIAIAALGVEAGWPWWKEQKETSHHFHCTQVGRLTPSFMGERRCLRTFAEQQPFGKSGSSVSKKSRRKERPARSRRVPVTTSKAWPQLLCSS